MGMSALSRLAGRAQRMLKLPELPIAIDFGVGSVKILQITASEHPEGPPTLVSAACVETPAELLSDPAKRLTYQCQALPRMFKSCGFKGKRVVCAIPSSRSVCRHMQFTSGDAASITGQASTLFPMLLGVDHTSMLVKHYEVGHVGRAKPGSGKTEVICMGVERRLVDELMGAIVGCKAEPVGMHSEFTAIIRAFAHITRRQEDQKLVSLYVDLGAGTTKVVLAHGMNLVFARSVEFGGRHLDDAVAEALKSDRDGARQKRLALIPSGPGASTPVVPRNEATDQERRRGAPASGLTPDIREAPVLDALPGNVDEPLEILTDEIATSLRYYEALFPDRKIDRVLFVGGEARHLGLCQHLARTLKLPAQIADPMASVSRTGREPATGVDFKVPQPGWAVALGLCLSPTDL
jgi:Tfp pilus assembly PilM family ATPase